MAVLTSVMVGELVEFDYFIIERLVAKMQMCIQVIWIDKGSSEYVFDCPQSQKIKERCMVVESG